MAQEITVSASVRASKSGNTVELGKFGLGVTWTGTNRLTSVQSIGTTQETLSLGETSQLGTTLGGYAVFINRGTTSGNYITLRTVTGDANSNFCRLDAGEIAVLRLSCSAIYAISTSAEQDLEYLILEN